MVYASSENAIVFSSWYHHSKSCSLAKVLLFQPSAASLHKRLFLIFLRSTKIALVPLASFTEFTDLAAQPAVRGFLHLPAQANGDALILTHGAGANCQSKLLLAVSQAFAEAGF